MITGLRGDDAIIGLGGNDVVCGGPGADTVSGGLGGDHLIGGPDDDVLSGGSGNDALNGGNGNDQAAGGDGTNVCGLSELEANCASFLDLVTDEDRDLIRLWSSWRTIAELNDAVGGLDETLKATLPSVLLDSNATGISRDRLLGAMARALGHPDLGFYEEIWSYTRVELTGDGFFGACGHVWLSPTAFASLSDDDVVRVLLHESLHSFICMNHGPGGAMNEGAAIWIFKASLFADELLPGESWAEATYGTKLFYRDIQGDPDYPLTTPANASDKLIELFQYLAANDPSRLPWNSEERMSSCFEAYWEQLDRDVDFYTVWLPSAAKATNQMLMDSECAPL